MAKKKVAKKKVAKKTTAKKNAPQKKTQKTVQVKVHKKVNTSAPILPLGNRVLVLKTEAFEKTNSGLFIPATAQEKPLKGKVIAVGPGLKNKHGVMKPMDVQVGDHVMYEKYAGAEIKMDGVEYLILQENEIIGVLS